jgi:hypothetical protein
MIPNRVNLDTIDFDGLVELARSRLPSLSKQWTDYNYSDPGITLLDLVAWTADSQIYALARDRRDERTAFAALFGVRPGAALPARGTLYPIAADLRSIGPRSIKQNTRLTAVGASAPPLEVAHAFDLLPLSIEAVVSEGPWGAIDHTAANANPRATFVPFGAPTDPNGRLVVRLRMDPAVPRNEVLLSLGFALHGADTPDERLGKVEACYRIGGVEHVVNPELDGSAGMQRDGAMVLKLPSEARDRADFYEIVLRPGGAIALLPRLLRVAPNALPAAQRVTIARDMPGWGNGRPGQRLVIKLSDLLDIDPFEGPMWRIAVAGDPNEPSKPVVTITSLEDKQRWKPGDPDNAGPGARVFALDEDADGRQIVFWFGNGVNGRRPAAGSTLHLDTVLSCGASGGIASPLEWFLEGHGLRWTNPAAVGGGENSPDVADLLSAARKRLREQRALATSRQIADAAMGLPKTYAVSRAEVEEGWEPGRAVPALPRTRTLVVARDPQDGAPTESPAWTRAIKSRLAARLALGERLVVTAPRYVRFTITASVVAARGRVPATVAAAVRADLMDRLTPSGRRGAAWPLGRAVAEATVGGWIGMVPGVARVSAYALRDEAGRKLERIDVGRGALPVLVDAQVTAEPGAGAP